MDFLTFYLMYLESETWRCRQWIKLYRRRFLMSRERFLFYSILFHLNNKVSTFVVVFLPFFRSFLLLVYVEIHNSFIYILASSRLVSLPAKKIMQSIRKHQASREEKIRKTLKLFGNTSRNQQQQKMKMNNDIEDDDDDDEVTVLCEIRVKSRWVENMEIGLELELDGGEQSLGSL